MFAHVGGGIECCACRIAPKVKTVFAEGVKNHPLFGDLDACSECGGEGCDNCTMHGSIHINSYDEALEHLQKHRDNGDKVPEYAFEGLKRDRDEDRPLEPLLCACGEPAMIFDFNGPPKCAECGLKEEAEDE